MEAIYRFGAKPRWKVKDIFKMTILNLQEKQGPIYVREIEIRYKKQRVKQDAAVHKSLTSAAEVVALFRDLENETKEKLITINLDSQYKILCFEMVGMGAVNSFYVRPMEVFRTAFPVNAYGAIVIHNHPSGDPTPSEEDARFTQKLMRLANDMGLEFVDHIVVGNNGYFSFREQGLLSPE